MDEKRKRNSWEREQKHKGEGGLVTLNLLKEKSLFIDQTVSTKK